MTKVMALTEIRRLIKEGRGLLGIPKTAQSGSEPQAQSARWNLACRNVLHMMNYPVVPFAEQFSQEDDDFRLRVQEQIAVLEALANTITGELGVEAGKPDSECHGHN